MRPQAGAALDDRCRAAFGLTRSAQQHPAAARRQAGTKPAGAGAAERAQLQVGSGLMHAAVAIDPNSRFIIDFRLSNTADIDLCLHALADVCRDYCCPAIFHRHKGSLFASRSFKSELRRRGIKQSMTGRLGWKDNVIVERFIWCLKKESTRLREWTSGSKVRSAYLLVASSASSNLLIRTELTHVPYFITILSIL